VRLPCWTGAKPSIEGVVRLLIAFLNQNDNPTSMITKEIEAIFAGQDIGDGDIDIDGVLKALDRLMDAATKADLPQLVTAIQSPRNSFWTRELFSCPICKLGGSDCLEILLEANQLNFDEGHDNDLFNTNLIEVASAEPNKCRDKIEQLLARSDFKYREAAIWLLEFCTTSDRS
jgi:hypothetical protein